MSWSAHTFERAFLTAYSAAAEALADVELGAWAERGGPLTIDGTTVDLRVKLVAPHALQLGTVHLSIVAPFVGARRLSVAIAAGSYFIAWGRQDERLGHAAFDDRYLVKCADPALARLWLGPDELDAILRTYAPLAPTPLPVTIDHGLVRFASSGPYADIGWDFQGCADAVAACGVLSGRARRLAAAWRTRGEALGLVAHGDHFDVDGGFALRSETRRVPLELTFPDALPDVRRLGPRTVVRAPRTSPSPRTGALWRDALPRTERPAGSKLRDDGFHLAAMTGHDHGGPWLEAALAPHAARLAAAAPDAITIHDAIVELRWEAYVDNPARLAPALDLVEALAAPLPTGVGPYR